MSSLLGTNAVGKGGKGTPEFQAAFKLKSACCKSVLSVFGAGMSSALKHLHSWHIYVPIFFRVSNILLLPEFLYKHMVDWTQIGEASPALSLQLASAVSQQHLF